MSEFDNAIRILGNRSSTQQQHYGQGISQGIRRVLLAGQSQIQQELSYRYMKAGRSGTVVITSNNSASIVHRLQDSDDAIIVQRDNNRIYDPFSRHQEERVYRMMLQVLEAGSVNERTKMALRAFSALLAVDNGLMEAVSMEGCSLALMEGRIESLKLSGCITRDQAARLDRGFNSAREGLLALTNLLGDLSVFFGSMRSGNGFRVRVALEEMLRKNTTIVFVMDCDLNDIDIYDQMMRKLLACDLTFCIQDIPGIRFIYEDLPYQYLQAFGGIIQKPSVSCLFRLETQADYYEQPQFGHLARSYFDCCMLTKNTDTKACEFWSQALGNCRTVEYNYNQTDGFSTRCPLHRSVGSLFGTWQSSGSQGYHFVDRNRYQPYDFRDLGPAEFLLWDCHDDTVEEGSLY